MPGADLCRGRIRPSQIRGMAAKQATASLSWRQNTMGSGSPQFILKDVQPARDADNRILDNQNVHKKRPALR
jgi:hypothetical protein